MRSPCVCVYDLTKNIIYIIIVIRSNQKMSQHVQNKIPGRTRIVDRPRLPSDIETGGGEVNGKTALIISDILIIRKEILIKAEAAGPLECLRKDHEIACGFHGVA